VAEHLSRGDLATLSLLDPDQGVCPSGHRCRLASPPGDRTCDACDYRGRALVCWDVTRDTLRWAEAEGASRVAVAWAVEFLADR
jgi:hypothetical protein